MGAGKMYSSLWIRILLCLSVAIIECHDEVHPLCFYLKTSHIKQINVTVGNLLDNNTTEQCGKPTDSCYMLWQENPLNHSVTVISQGCWNDANQKCLQNECIPERSTKARDHTHFCCCYGNFCNTNVTDAKAAAEVREEDPTLHFLGHMKYTMHMIITFVVLLVVCVLLGTVYALHRFYTVLPKRSTDSLYLSEAPPPARLTSFDLDTLKLQESLGKGRYGNVFRGSLNDQNVAVKIFSYHNKQHFLNEYAIYVLPHMEHPSLPNFIGSKERQNEDGKPVELLLVLSYTPMGCLKDYLKENTLDWNQLCRMSLSIASGLAHLHSEIKKGDLLKPCVVHRDVSSRNVLVRADGSCMLCDFGFAIQISGSKYILNGQEVKAEETSLSDVGTLRYMAPEMLEGAVNLRDCESSMKQTDIYALGLVLWEIASRCTDLYQGAEVPEHKLPYEAEIGTEPTMEQMQTLVVRRKARPLFPEMWKVSNPAVRSLKETIEDCWDQDSEARLTSLCVEERITELLTLWDWHKAGLTFPGSMSPSLKSVSNLHKSLNLLYNKSQDSDFGSEGTERPDNPSECTAETVLSPSDKNGLIGGSSPALKVTYPIQAFHGLNPCLAHNLKPDNVDNGTFPVSNSHPTKYSVSNKMISYSDGDTNIFSMPPGMESRLVAPSVRPARQPIPYLQNPVTSGKPKQSNLLQGAAAPESLRQNSLKLNEVAPPVSKRWNPLSIFDTKALRTSLRSLLERKGVGANIPEERQPLQGVVSPTSPEEGIAQEQPAPHWLDTKGPDLTPRPPMDKSLSRSVDSGCFFNSGPSSSRESDVQLLSVADERCQRPTTLPVGDAPPLRQKGVRRVKTPFEIKGRLSLYDDRIMSQESEGSGSQESVKLSLSVPLDMDALCTAGEDSADRVAQGGPKSGSHNVVHLCDI